MPKPPKIDKRLLGTWKSDRRLTLKHFKPRARLSEAKFRYFRSIFGKLVIRWGPKTYWADYEGTRSRQSYEVIATDASSVVVLVWSDLLQERILRQINFEDADHYWMALSGNLCEHFRRVPPVK